MFVGFLLDFDLSFILFRVALWERAVPLAFNLCSFNFSAVLVAFVPFPFGVWGRMWNSILSVPDHCHFYLLYSLHFSRDVCSVQN